MNRGTLRMTDVYKSDIKRNKERMTKDLGYYNLFYTRHMQISTTSIIFVNKITNLFEGLP